MTKILSGYSVKIRKIKVYIQRYARKWYYVW